MDPNEYIHINASSSMDNFGVDGESSVIGGTCKLVFVLSTSAFFSYLTGLDLTGDGGGSDVVADGFFGVAPSPGRVSII